MALKIAYARSRRTRAARQSVIFFFVLFAGIQIVTALAAEEFPRIRDRYYGDKRAKLQKRINTKVEQLGQTPFTVVQFGSSRTGMAFHGQVLEEKLSPRKIVAFNFGMPAGGPVCEWLYLRRLLQEGIRPDLVLVELMPTMFAATADAPREHHWFPPERWNRSESRLVVAQGFPARATFEKRLQIMALPVYGYRFELMSRVVPSWLTWRVRSDWSSGSDECGWIKATEQYPDAQKLQQAQERARAEYAPILADLKVGGPAEKTLRELVTLCRTEKIPVRLILLPEGSTFRSYYGPNAESQLTAFVQRITREEEVTCLDHRLRLPDDAFFDGHHMTEKGAERYSEIVAQEVILPELERAGEKR